MIRFRRRSDSARTTSSPAAENAARLLRDAGVMLGVLDHVHMNVFVADENFELVYMNEYAKRTLAELDPELRATYGLSVSELLFGSIHRFHRDPRQVERVLRSALPHRTKLRFGAAVLDATFDMVADPADGSPVAFVVTWQSVGAHETEARTVTEQLCTLSENLNDTSAALTDAAAATRDDITTVAASTEKLATVASDIARSAADATAAAASAVELTVRSRAEVDTLASSVESISDAATLIRRVAERTHILALNAKIEATRAGDAGKGFGVVADEIKALAAQAADAVSEIDQRVGVIGGDVSSVTGTLDDVEKAVARIDVMQANITAAVNEHARATGDISASIQRIAESAHGSASAAEAVAETAGALDGRVVTLGRLLDVDAAPVLNIPRSRRAPSAPPLRHHPATRR